MARDGAWRAPGGPGGPRHRSLRRLFPRPKDVFVTSRSSLVFGQHKVRDGRSVGRSSPSRCQVAVPSSQNRAGRVWFFTTCSTGRCYAKPGFLRTPRNDLMVRLKYSTTDLLGEGRKLRKYTQGRSRFKYLLWAKM